MSIVKFINSVKESLGLDEFEKAGKKKSVKRLLKKLRARKEKIEKSLEKKLEKKKKKELEEEFDIISCQIKKGEKIKSYLRQIIKLLGKRFSETQWDSLKMEHVLILEVNT